jgi:dGTPase
VLFRSDLASNDFPELDEYLPGLRPPLEAQLIDLCDEIAYNAADLDDAYFAGMLRLEEATRAVDKVRELDDAANMQFPGAPERVRVHEIVRGLINWLVSGLMEGTLAAASGLANVDEVRAHPQRVVRFSPETAAGTAQMKGLLRSTVYESEQLAESRKLSMGRIQALFKLFMEQPGLMPVNYLEETEDQPMHRRVGDYIAGMTDRFLLQTCLQMNVP